ncbi:biopolymer transporter ExbD [Ramlibacter sp. 2FC]|uniref:ExbD/TolR family protein n=1 Tax=Ramlibacter sp. 2FC TaxID=2502188 RepID=UPI0010F4ABB1|nr:biopolymer transporter ExbD [Ramlibacter sp. 2FC]
MSFGRLERSKGPRPMSEINMTPLVDVMLVLVVIFIVTAPLLGSSIRLDLPRSEAARPDEAAQAVTLVVDRNGQAYLDDRPVRDAELAQRLAQAAALAPDTEVQLRADAGVPYGRMVELVGLAQQAGLSRIGFMAEAPRATANPP